jgi:hypothetical protein
MFDPSETLACGCLIVWKSERAYVTPCSEQHRTVARMMRKPGSTLIVLEVPK